MGEITEINSDTATFDPGTRCRRGCQSSPLDLHIGPQHSCTMSERRRQEIEAKRAKLAELRKAREDRQKQTERRISEVRSPDSTRVLR